ncbi:prepilin-type N-terminal cleavage/methylation domain-containing protein [Sporosarcina sp. ANT_H38]|uniref:prepilin-type N-terminal cleavage/methylation domain-containing protein n=1 Tax=Sporosarcina sp. ANT_H38 TaxID=2597358 RepID=UPI0011F27505|nr:prepilin-type N-terminal cleavage/methylation domain-containing protein [Sporosarcina sp. ANT_H38]KAA0965348.1 prepilin-type N-terminal cleavage/methylation domain-containing protein [Sporosarcina sp. ANT_H38]
MKKFLQKRLNNEKGLTLVELLAVIVILGIIAAIAIPSIGGIIENSRIKAVKADAQNVLSAANMYFTENPEGTSPVTIATLKTEKFLEDEGKLESGVTVTNNQGESNTISGNGKAGNKTVVFTNATNKQITDSKNSLTVPAPATP